MNADGIGAARPICEVAFQVNDSRASITRFLGLLTPFVRIDGPREWTLDLTECQYLGPDAAAVIFSAVLEARANGQTVEVRLPKEPEQLRAFCMFSGLEHELANGPSPELDHPQNVTAPLRVIRQANFKDADPLIELVMRQTGIADESAEYLRLCVNEVTQNIEDHAESRIGGVCCGRFMKASSEVRVAVVDRGVGIATSLRQRYPEIVNGQIALTRVIEGGYSALSRRNNAGLGLSQLWNFVRHLKGSILIISEDGLAEHHETRRDTISSLNPPYPGTAIFFTLPVQTDTTFDKAHD